jgi:ADP-ribosyl-[dinitrogen reductase] hydrolase
MTRTSVTHPLQIATVRPSPTLGRIGVTFCPGKKQLDALTGAWDRDLQTDIAVIAGWGAAAVLTLVEEHELRSLNVEALGEAVRRNHMDWIHAPIPDFSVPDGEFERRWASVGEGLRARLRSGFDVVIHCKGGLGRAGMIAARLMAEMGVSPADAVVQVHRALPGAIETEDQRHHVLGIHPVPEVQPSTDASAIEDRALGAMLGLAMGDAVGTTLEFRGRDTYEPLADMVGGGPFRLEPGQWTDDTALALALAESLAAKGGLDEQDLLARFVAWWRTGEYSCTGTCFDIGGATAGALSRWERTGEPHCGSAHPQSAGNGSLMRLAPVAIRFWRDRPRMRDAAARQSCTTHAAPEAVDSCVVYAEILADALAGRPRSEVLKDRSGGFAGRIDPIAAGSWRGKARQAIDASGCVAHSLEASLWSVGRTADFRTAVLLAANLGQDADTTAAITGQLAGALYGAASLPSPGARSSPGAPA